MKKLNKSILISLLGLVMLFPVSCSKKEEAPVDPTPVEPSPEQPTKTSEEIKLEAQVTATETYNTNTKNMSIEDKIVYDVVYGVLLKDIDSLSGDATNVQTKVNTILGSLNTITNSFKNPSSDLKEYALNQIDLIKTYGVKYLSTTKKDELVAIIDEYKDIIQTINVSQIKGTLVELKLSVFSLLEDYVSLAVNNFKELLKSELDHVVKTIINKVDDTTLKQTLQNYYNLKETAINALNTINECKSFISTLKEDAKEYAIAIGKQQIAKYKDVVIEKLDAIFTNTIDKIENSTLKTTLTNAYNTAKTKLANIEDIDTYKEKMDDVHTDLVSEVKEKVKDFIFNDGKDKLDTFIKDNVDKITNTTLKNGCLKVYNDAITELAAIEYSDDYKANVKATYETAIVDIKETIVLFLKNDCKDKLDLVVENTINNIESFSIKEGLTNTYYTAINDLNNIVYSENIEETFNTLYTNFYNNVIDTVKTYLKDDCLLELNLLFDSYIKNVTNTTLKNGLTNAYNDTIEDVEDLTYSDNYKADLNTLYTNLLKNVKDTIVTFLKKDCKDKLDDIFTDAIVPIENETIKATLTNIYNDACEDLALIEYTDDIESIITQLYQDVLENVNEGLRQIVKDEIDKYVAKAGVVYNNLSKGLSTESKNLLTTLYNAFVSEINQVDKKEDVLPVFADFTDDIKNLTIQYLNNIRDKFEFNPNVWIFFPSSFKTRYQLSADVTIPTYEDFTNVSDIPSIYMGKQLYAVQKVLNKAEKCTSILSTISNTLSNVGTAYDSIFNSSKTDDIVIDTTNFKLTIKIDDTATILDAELANSVTVHMYENNNGYGAKLNLGSNNIIKYDIADNQLVLAMDISGYATTSLTFNRDNSGNVNGYMIDSYGVGNTRVTETSYLYIDTDYTYAVGNKGDFIVDATDKLNCEVYKNSDATFVGSEVYEKDSKNKEYNTIWFNLDDINGISSIKKQDKSNGLNPDKIWINNSSDTIHTKNVATLDFSRRFDIEFKTVYSFVLNAETGEYEVVSYEVPLMFIQENFVETFASDFESKNSNSVTSGSVSIQTPTTDLSAINYGYYTLSQQYNLLKDTLTYETIKNYLES